MSAPVPRSVATRVRQIRDGGSDVLWPVPRSEQLARKSPTRRREILDDLRVDLYALSSLVADAAVDRARRHRSAYPPYGLVRSGYSASRLVVAEPEPFAGGSITGFDALGRAFVDTTVFHLHATWHEQRHAAGWVLEHLEELLSLFRDVAGPAGEARMRDGISFLYGGLHFGTGVSVQLVEVMATVLQGDHALSLEDRVAILQRSSRPALRLAGLNVEQVVGAFQDLQADGKRKGWMAAEHFMLITPDDGPARIDLREDGLSGEGRGSFPYATLGCPARVAAGESGVSPITGLWGWSIELARDTGLLGAGSG
ncbi:MAG TPA: hypothetical protein VGR26_01080 [Acidimicrobiales bacterium]|nr:hypothetical protein [Acidimicrobiales bacterium]